jgi:hypothetical protein
LELPTMGHKNPDDWRGMDDDYVRLLARAYWIIDSS